MSKDGRTDVHDEERSVQPAICGEYKVKEGTSQFQNFMWISTNFSTLLYEIITVRLGCHKFCARWVPKMISGAHNMQEQFPSAIPQRWQWISQSHHTSNRWWNMGFISEYWNQRVVRAADAHQTNRKSSKERCLPARKMLATVFWDRKGLLIVKFLQKGTTVTSEVYSESLKTA
jgi:hypothetical protein